MSTEEEVEKLYYCIENGAVDFIVKPIRIHAIKQLEKYINKKEAPIKQENGSENDYERLRTVTSFFQQDWIRKFFKCIPSSEQTRWRTLCYEDDTDVLLQ